SFLGPHVLYLAYFVSALVVTRIGGGSGAFCVLILGSCAGLFRSLPFPSAMTTDPAWEAWTLSLYYGAGVACILILDFRRQSRPSSGPHLAHRPHRQTEFSERKQAEQALRESEERFRVLVEQAADAFFVLDKKGRFVDVNHMACEILGYSPPELVGMSVVDVEQEFDQEGVEELLSRVESGRAFTAHANARRKDGTCFPVEVRLSRYTIQGQQLFLALVYDITGRQTRERELDRTNRLYAILSAVNRTILRVTTREDLFREICRITVEHVGFKVVWVGWHDPETHAVVPIASAGDQEGYLDGIKVYADERPE